MKASSKLQQSQPQTLGRSSKQPLLGIVRNKTEIFLQIKDSRKKKVSRFSKLKIMGDNELGYEMSPIIKKPLQAVDSDRDQLNQQSDHSTTTATGSGGSNGGNTNQNTGKKGHQNKISLSGKSSVLPPVWIDHYEESKFLLAQIDEIKRNMMTQQSRRLTCIHQSEQKQIQTKIYDLASQATKKIKKCQLLLEKIKKYSDFNPTDASQTTDRQSAQNVLYKLASSLRERTRQIRAQQRAFMEQRQSLQKSTRATFLEMAAQKMLQDDYTGNDDLVMQQEQEQYEQLEQRNSEISKIVKSIHDLNELYKQLNTMVILQGSLLDRIDFNIQDAHKNVYQGQQHIQKAQKYQKKTASCACKVMVIFLIGICILGIVLVIKWSKK